MYELDFLNDFESRSHSSAENVRKLLSIATKYRTLYEVGKLIATEMDLDALLRSAMDKVIEVTNAQRGFIGLVDSENRFEFKVARNMESADIDNPSFQVSRSIIDKVTLEGQTICLGDAMASMRAGGAESVDRLHLLSVLCVPIAIDSKISGFIYVDNLHKRDVFDAQIEELLSAFSQQMAIALKNSLAYRDLDERCQHLADDLRGKYRFDNIIGFSPQLKKTLETVAAWADTDATVLIQGESGTGKELIARALHHNSSRFREVFVPVNCAALPRELIESELFGHERGAFSGAVNLKIGLFEAASGGTLFLDEIGELRPELQAKLLRVLDEKRFRRVGGIKEIDCDVRIVAATNRNLSKMVRDHSFRQDLYFRLESFNLKVPPLRERQEDIEPLITHFLRQDQAKHQQEMPLPEVSSEALALLKAYDFPGNVRELKGIIDRALILSKGRQIEVNYLPEKVTRPEGFFEGDSTRPLTFQERKKRVIQKFEQDELKRLLSITGGKLREAARIAGMDAKNFSEKLQKYGIRAKDFKK